MWFFRRSKARTSSRIFTKTNFWSDFVEIQHFQNFPSLHLDRKVKLDIFLPPDYYNPKYSDLPLLLFNDGQDMEAVKLMESLEMLYQRNSIPPMIIVGIYAGNRLQEYGTAGIPDYKNRGKKADAYIRFIKEELVPYLQYRYKCSKRPQKMGFAGFSLGGLSAFDIVWNHPDIFNKIGVFSGSLWWRSKPFKTEDPDANRIVHDYVSQGQLKKGLKFWFEAGTEDETDDRNNNGIIDAIDDTLQLIDILDKLGYDKEKDIKYVEVQGGQHHPDTWAGVIPDFLTWFSQDIK